MINWEQAKKMKCNGCGKEVKEEDLNSHSGYCKDCSPTTEACKKKMSEWQTRRRMGDRIKKGLKIT